MADLKTIDPLGLVAPVREAAERAAADIQRAADDACKEVAVAARALADLPPRASDLLERAASVLVAELDIPGGGSLNCGRVAPKLRLYDADAETGRVEPMGQSGLLPPGRYRALFVLTRIGGDVVEGG